MKCKYHKKHKYLKEFNDKPYPFFEDKYPPFDIRDTFSLDFTFVAWLYERLRYFQDSASKVVDFDFHEFEIDGETLTQQQCIDRMVEDCKVLLNGDFFIPAAKEFEKLDAAKDDLFNVFKTVFWAMWW